MVSRLIENQANLDVHVASQNSKKKARGRRVRRKLREIPAWIGCVLRWLVSLYPRLCFWKKQQEKIPVRPRDGRHLIQLVRNGYADPGVVEEEIRAATSEFFDGE